jgi:hypothetical protein
MKAFLAYCTVNTAGLHDALCSAMCACNRRPSEEEIGGIVMQANVEKLHLSIQLGLQAKPADGNFQFFLCFVLCHL